MSKKSAAHSAAEAKAKAREVYAKIQAEWDRAVREYEKQTGDKFPCGPGCADCCQTKQDEPFAFQPMSRPEASVLWETFISLPLAARKLITNRARCNHTGTCVFLSDDGLCLIYEGRPLWCRIFGLSGVSTCQKVSPVKTARWEEAVQEAHKQLRGDGQTMVLLSQMIGGL